MSVFTLPETAADPLLNLIGRFRDDPRSDKIDLGVGVYRDDYGNTPVLAAVKSAETILHEQQDSKSYLGLTGDDEFVSALADLVFGQNTGRHIAGAQTPGGSGGLRLAAEAYKAAHPDGTLWVGLPTWPNHLPLIQSAGVHTRTYPGFSRETQTILFDSLLEHLNTASPGDAVLLHGCCHNPTGADLTEEQWTTLAGLLQQKELIPLVDLAYHGLGSGMSEDLKATRIIVASCAQTLVAVSCSKNFGLYRDRVGAVYLAADDQTLTQRGQAYFGQSARLIYSMPPDHGAAVVRLILTDDQLRDLWQTELNTMVKRVQGLRHAIATSGTDLGMQFVNEQRGMFSLLELQPEQVDTLINKHSVYLAGDGRINIAGCQLPQVERFIDALSQVGFNSG